MLDCSIRMAVCCSALTIFDVRLLKGGVTMRLRLVDLGASISALCCRSQIGLVLGSALKNCIDGNPKNIHIRFNSESHPPVERHGLPKGMVRLRSTGSFHQKECFDYFCDFDASVCRWYRARLTRSAIQDAIDARPADAKLTGDVAWPNP